MKSLYAFNERNFKEDLYVFLPAKKNVWVEEQNWKLNSREVKASVNCKNSNIRIDIIQKHMAQLLVPI